MSEDQERRTVGASEAGHAILKRLQADGIFPEMMDAYRFAIAIGLALGKRTPVVGRRTVFNVGSFDRDESLANIVATLTPVDPGTAYRAAEEFAETGFAAISESVESGEFRFADMFDVVRKSNPDTGQYST